MDFQFEVLSQFMFTNLKKNLSNKSWNRPKNGCFQIIVVKFV